MSRTGNYYFGRNITQREKSITDKISFIFLLVFIYERERETSFHALSARLPTSFFVVYYLNDGLHNAHSGNAQVFLTRTT